MAIGSSIRLFRAFRKVLPKIKQAGNDEIVAGHWLVPPMHIMSCRISGSLWIIFDSTLYAG